MSWLEVFRIAVRALLRNKTRSFLTALGIIIGVGAVIAMVAIGAGAKAQVEQAFASMGTNVVVVMPGSTQSGGARGGFGSMPTLTWEDLKAIQDPAQAPSVRYAAPVLRSNQQIMSEDQNWTTSVQGTTPEYLDIRNWGTERGNRFTATDVESGNKVALLGATVSDKLFGPDADPVGQMVRIKNVNFQVAGVLERKGQSAMGQDYDDAVLVPSTTFLTKIQGGLAKYLNGVVFIGAASADATSQAQTEITALLRDRHRLPAGSEDDFSIRDLTEVASAQEQGTRTLTALLASIAAVSLLVGGIGIMNIMLVSVTERTREIGIRMAVGARPRDILSQFLVEAFTLSVAGGVFGLALGAGVAQWLAWSSGWPLLIQPQVATLSIGFSALVGIGFGLYPARKASQLDPIDALRYE
jgi:putative ABC transport system permease protein